MYSLIVLEVEVNVAHWLGSCAQPRWAVPRDFMGDQKALCVPTWLLITNIQLVELHGHR